MLVMSSSNPLESDPFFALNHDSEWNACVGSQGEQENYIDGYLESAVALAETVIAKKLYGQRDTLVLPILYTARHGIELALKYVTEKLVSAGIISRGTLKRNHNIKAYLAHLQGSNIGDEQIRNALAALIPFVESLSRVDADGQQLRYHETRDHRRSMEGVALVNFQVVLKSLHALKDILDGLQYRTRDFVYERRAGTVTSRCSRADLLEIAMILPRRELWRSEAFTDAKDVIQKRFHLSNKAFSNALDKVQENREMRVVLQMDTPLAYLSDDDLIKLAELWRHLHPPREQEEGEFTIYTSFGNAEEMMKSRDILKSVIDQLEKALSVQQLAELEVMFYLGRDNWFVEIYEVEIEKRAALKTEGKDRREKMRHLLLKTNFLSCITVAVARLGRRTLSEKLMKM
ncbi:hypothetical protein [Aestuariivirga sp.]|uniref:hypothetical protein n=1 Tax=Aestuariivirga sp. TaxID=2650926 RepID=UPI0039E5888C